MQQVGCPAGSLRFVLLIATRSAPNCEPPPLNTTPTMGPLAAAQQSRDSQLGRTRCAALLYASLLIWGAYNGRDSSPFDHSARACHAMKASC
jgi:hypothetical protein